MKHKTGFYYQYIGETFNRDDDQGGFTNKSLYQCIKPNPLMLSNDIGNNHYMENLKHEFVIPQNMTNRQLMDLCGCGNETELSKPFNPYLK